MIRPKTEIRKYREFATVLSLGALFFFTLAPWIRGRVPHVWPWGLALVLALFALFMPTRLKLVYQLWIGIGDGLGWVNSRVILSVLYFAVLTPIGVLMRIGKWDPLRLRLRADETTYRQAALPRTRKSMEQMF